MATTMVSAAVSVVGKALAPFTKQLAQGLRRQHGAGHIRGLELELKSVKAVFEPTLGRELLEELQGLKFDAEDVLDELDYFCMQDELDGTFDAADKNAKGCTHNLALNVHLRRFMALLQ
ncbi:unnamed protein product [Urochloa humidicola]